MIDEKEERKKKKVGRRKKGESIEEPKPKKEKGAKSRIMNRFLQQLSDKYPGDTIICVMDGASWHKSQYTVVPNNIFTLFIPPRTPEMNPIEQVWREIRTIMGNRAFPTIKAVMAEVKKVISEISPETFQSITQRDWFMRCINPDTE